MKRRILSLSLLCLLLIPNISLARGHGNGVRRCHSQNKVNCQNDYIREHKHNKKTGLCTYGEYCPNNHEYNRKTKVCNYGEDCPICYK